MACGMCLSTGYKLGQPPGSATFKSTLRLPASPCRPNQTVGSISKSGTHRPSLRNCFASSLCSTRRRVLSTDAVFCKSEDSARPVMPSRLWGRHEEDVISHAGGSLGLLRRHIKPTGETEHTKQHRDYCLHHNNLATITSSGQRPLPTLFDLV
jgi:hypothetical protein